MGGGGGSSGTKRYAEYVEDAHKGLVTEVRLLADDVLVSGTHNSHSPYFNIATNLEDPSEWFYGGHAQRTALYDAFEDYMENVDIVTLFNTISSTILSSSTITNDIDTHGTYLSDDIEQEALPRVNAGMRDINAVMSTGFIHNKTILEAQRIKALNKYASVLKIKAFDTSVSIWSEKIKWNIQLVNQLQELAKLYHALQFDYVESYGEYKRKDIMWPFTVYDIRRSMIATLEGGVPSAGVTGPSQGQKAISGALGGASVGAQLGSVVPGLGTATGAIVGGFLGLAGGLLS